MSQSTIGIISTNTLSLSLLSLPPSPFSTPTYLVVENSKGEDSHTQHRDDHIHNLPKQAHVETTATFHPSLGTTDVTAVVGYIEG